MRHVRLQHAHNFRDLGYYLVGDKQRTKPGLLFRSDTLSRLDEADRKVVQGLGIKSVFDMRREDEQQREGLDSFADPVEVFYVPTGLESGKFLSFVSEVSGEFEMLQLYLQSFDERAGYHAALFRQLADPDLMPAVFHCSAGKDRTGIMAALLLGVAGVAEELIVADYAETAENMREMFARQREAFQHSGSGTRIIDELFSSHAHTMEGLLKYINKNFGSAGDYLMSGGVTAPEIEAFCELFVEEVR